MARKQIAVTRLDAARAAYSDANARIGKLETARVDAILADDDDKAAKLDAELEAQRRLVRVHLDKIKLLEAEAEREAGERRVREREGLLKRFEKKLADADAIAVELQDLVALADKKFRRIIELREEARMAFAVRTPHAAAAAGAPEGCAMAGAAVKTLLAFELYRVGAKPYFGGDAGQRRQVDFPGGVSPRTEWALQPEKIAPFAETLKKGSQFAVELLREEFALPPAPPAPAPPVVNGNGDHGLYLPLDKPQAAAAVEAPPAAPVFDPPPVADPKTLGELIKRQIELERDTSPAGEAEYKKIVAQISHLQ